MSCMPQGQAAFPKRSSKQTTMLAHVSLLSSPSRYQVSKPCNLLPERWSCWTTSRRVTCTCCASSSLTSRSRFRASFRAGHEPWRTPSFSVTAGCWLPVKTNSINSCSWLRGDWSDFFPAETRMASKLLIIITTMSVLSASPLNKSNSEKTNNNRHNNECLKHLVFE